jgi:DNA-binding response OmpR family regulator
MSASVLVVDDDPGIRAALEVLLKHAGLEVSVACNGREALRQLASRPPAVILLDLIMPEMDGWDFLTQARTTTPVIVVSGTGHRTRRHLPGNVVTFLPKPFDVTALLATVYRCLAVSGHDRPTVRRPPRRSVDPVPALLDRDTHVDSERHAPLFRKPRGAHEDRMAHWNEPEERPEDLYDDELEALLDSAEMMKADLTGRDTTGAPRRSIPRTPDCDDP